MGSNRIYAMDVLRAVAMYLGIVLHSAIVYQQTPRPGWPRDLYASGAFDFFYETVHSFRMQLFFLVAGFFANLLIRKIGVTSFMEHRLRRVVIPFVCSIVLITPFSSLAFNYYKNVTSGLAFAESWFRAFEQAMGWNGLFHLWFLYYLLMFYMLTVFALLIKSRYFKGIELGVRYDFKSTILYTIMVFAITYLFFDINVEPWTGAVPRVNQLLYYGFFYGVGFFLYNKFDSLWEDANMVWYYLFLGFSSTIVLFLFHDLGREVHLILAAIQTVFLTFGSLALFLKFCERGGFWVQYFSDASYWFYLLHFPLVTIAQVLLIDVHVFGPLKFGIVLTVSTIVCLVTYHLFVRYSIIGEVLNGKRSRVRTF